MYSRIKKSFIIRLPKQLLFNKFLYWFCDLHHYVLKSYVLINLYTFLFIYLLKETFSFLLITNTSLKSIQILLNLFKEDKKYFSLQKI